MLLDADTLEKSVLDPAECTRHNMMAEHTSSDSDAGMNPAPSNGSRGLSTNGAGHLPVSPQGMHGGPHQSVDAGADGLFQILARQWPTLTFITLAAVVLSVLYLMLVHNTYTAMSKLRVIPMDPQSIASSTNSGNAVQVDSDFLDTECIVIKSNSVLALAMDKVRNTHTLAGMAKPMDYLRAKLTAEPSKMGQVIEVSFDSQYPEDATAIASAVVDAYKEYESNAWKTRAEDYLHTLQTGTLPEEQALEQTEKRMHEIENTLGVVPDIDPDKSSQHLDVLNLREELQKAQIDSLKATAAYEQASKAVIGIPRQVNAVKEAEQKAGLATDPETQLKMYQEELSREQARMVDDARQFGPNHPTIRTDQARVDQLVVATVVAAKQWQESTQAQAEAIQRSLSDAQKKEVIASDNQQDYIRLQREAENLKKSTEDVNTRINQIDLTKGAGALNIMVLNEAELTGEVKPPKPKTMAIGLVLGVITGLAVACVRDWTDDRMRTPQAIRATVGVPVLGAIPNILTAYTAADRGQIVHHDPFGDAAESYRTLRTALQFGMPAGAKTLLITSPMPGDGKSTFVSNLGIALAQASRRVLIIDADLRAPTQHRIFNLRDPAGLASVLGGVDSMEQAIQHTEIEGLDVLPCGPTPSNPAEMLNSPAFAEHLNDLADKYDIVLLDSPPVTAVADARILAASVDLSLMVIRLETSTRKQAEAARDGLRSVGARLIGIAVNGVPRNGNFGGASGYYAQGTLRSPTGRAVRRPYEDAPSSAKQSSGA